MNSPLINYEAQEVGACHRELALVIQRHAASLDSFHHFIDSLIVFLPGSSADQYVIHVTDYSRNPFEDRDHCALETFPETQAMKGEFPIRCYDCGEKLRLGIQRNMSEARIGI